MDREAWILDYGCGYGRLVADLAEFPNTLGVDVSRALIERARQAHPGRRFEVLTDPPTVNLDSSSVDVALLFAVLTCVPDDADQRRLIAELARVLRPGGLLYVSDLLLAPHHERYEAYRGHLPFGTFVTDDGAVCRHHDAAHLRELLAGFEPVRERNITVTTMNGNQASAIQLLARR